jgi:hypothetical protein
MTGIMMKFRGAAPVLLLLLAVSVPGFAQDDLPLVNTTTISPVGVDTFSISYGSHDVIIRESDTGSFVLKEYMEKDRPRYYSRVSRSEGTVIVRQGQQPWFHWFRKQPRVEIYLPGEFRKNLMISLSSGTISAETDIPDYRNIDLSVNSGSAVFKRVSAETLSIRVSSGSLDIADAGGNALISLSSGRLQIENLAGTEHRVKTSSGRMRIGSLQGASGIEVSSGGVVVEKAAGRMNVAVMSGSVSIGELSGEGGFELSSGVIGLGLRELTGDLHVAISSGTINVSVPMDVPFILDAVTKSGVVTISERGDEALRIYGNSTVLRPIGSSPVRTIYTRTGSGTVRINRK